MAGSPMTSSGDGPVLVEINGNRLMVGLQGPADASQTVITIHGAPGLSSRHDSAREYGFLADRVRVVVYDARGSGDSEANPPLTNEQWVDDVEGIRDWLGVETTLVAGSSYGGAIAMQYAIEHPSRVEGLVLRGAAPDGDHIRAGLERALRSDRNTVDRATWERYLSGGLTSDDDLAEAWRRLLPLYGYDYQPEEVSRIMAEATFHYQSQNAAMQNMASYDLKPRLAEIRCPALVLAGSHDWIAAPEFSRTIAGLIPDAELVVFERSGHSPQTDEPALFEQTVRAFLDRLSPTR